MIISVLPPSGVRMGNRMMGFVLLSNCDHPQHQLWSREALGGSCETQADGLSMGKG